MSLLDRFSASERKAKTLLQAEFRSAALAVGARAAPQQRGELAARSLDMKAGKILRQGRQGGLFMDEESRHFDEQAKLANQAQVYRLKRCLAVLQQHPKDATEFANQMIAKVWGR